MRLLLPLVILWAVSPTAWAQSPDRWQRRGLEALENHAYPQAIEYLQWSVAHGGDWKSKLGLAKCKRALMDYEGAGRWYAEIIDQPGIPTNTYFEYGQSLMAAKDYDGASKWFTKFAEVSPNDPKSAIFRNLDRLVANMKGDSLLYQVQRLPINSKYSDFSPCTSGDKLLFASARPNDLGVQHQSTMVDGPMLDIYYSTVDSAGRWSRPKPYTELNSKLNEGPMAIDTASKTLFITRNDLAHNANRDKSDRQGVNRLRIETMTLVDGKWQDAAGMPFNHQAYAVGHPALSADGHTMYLVSDQPGGFGGTDLYVSHFDGNGWSDPANLGAAINSEGDELFPHLDREGQLYFSSNGHVGLGGLDIFTVQKIGNGQWGRVENLGYPINSEADDFGIVTTQEGSLGYFSSNRDRSPDDDDIFSFVRDWPRFECAPMVSNNYCFRFKDEAILDFDTLPFAYEWSFGDGFRARGIETRHCYEGPGVYQIEFNIIDTILHTVFMNQNGYEHIVRDIDQVTIAGPDMVALGTEIHLSAAKSILEGCTLERFYWELGDGTQSRGIDVQHQYAALGTYEIKLGVTGLPEEDGSLVCKACVTKQVTVVSPEALHEIESRRIEEKKRLLEDQQRWQTPELTLPKAEVGMPTDSTQKSLYSLKLLQSPDPIDLQKVPFNGMKSVGEVRTADGYVAYQGLEDSAKTLYPSFQAAKKLGLDEAIVVMVRDTASLSMLQPKVIKIPTRKNELGSTIIAAKLTSPDGTPLQTELTITDLENSEIVYRVLTDSLGRVEINLGNGKIYAWTAVLDDYLPAAGYLDLMSSTQIPNAKQAQKLLIKLQHIEDLIAHNETMRLDNIFFDFDSDHLRTISYAQIQAMARFMIDHPEYGVEVQAHTDNVGNDAYNLDLSHRRAYSVLKYMILSGYDTSHIRSTGFGELLPAVPNDTPENRQLNRRVEFRFYRWNDQ